jgi:hypothetical protein
MCDHRRCAQVSTDVWRILPPAGRLRRSANLGSVGLQKTNLVSSEIAPTRVVRHSSAMGGYKRQNQASSTVLKPSSGLRQRQRPMRRLAHGSRFLAISRGRSNTWTTPNFRGCSRPLPSRSIGVGGAPRIKSPPLRRPGRQHTANLRRYVTERPERLMRFRKEEQTSSGRRSGRGSNLRPSPGRSEYPSPW